MSTRVAKIWCDQARVILKLRRAEKPAEQLDARAAKVFKELNALRESVASNKGLVTDDELAEHESTFESIAVAIRAAAVSDDLIEVDRQSLRLSQLKKELAVLLATGKSEKREAERKLEARKEMNKDIEKQLERELKSVRDKPPMTTIPRHATDQDFLDFGVNDARNKVIEALKTAETRTLRDVELARSLLPNVQEAITKGEEAAKVRNDSSMTRGPIDATVQDFQDFGVFDARNKVIEALNTAAETRKLSDVEFARSLLPAAQEAITKAEKDARVAIGNWKDNLESLEKNLKIANFYVQQAEVFKSWAAENHDRKSKMSEVKGTSSYLTKASQPATFEWLREGTENFYLGVQEAKHSWKQGRRNEANKQAWVAKTAFIKVKNDVEKFQKIIVSDEIEKLKNENPDGPEARLSNVFDSKTSNGFKSSELITRVANVMGLKERLKNEGRALPELALGELVAIYSYTTEDYFMMNNCLLNNLGTLREPEVYDTLDAETKGQLGLIEEKQRDANFDEKLQALTKITADAVAKLPSFVPSHNQTVLGRGERDWNGAKEQYVANTSFAIQSFWSTGVGFKFPGKYQIEITPKPDGQSRGKVVGELSKNPHEMEVLFPPNTQFSVISVEDGNDEIKVKLVES